MSGSSARRRVLSRLSIAAVSSLAGASSLAATPAPPPRAPAPFAASAAAIASASTSASVTPAANALLRFTETLVLRARIGPRPGQIGLSTLDASAAPAGFAVLPEDRLVVLDRDNQRLQFFKSGKFERVLPLDLPTYDDIVKCAKGRLALLDRQREGTLLVLSYDGTVDKRLPLVGEGLTEAGAATGLVVRSDGLWLETPPNLLRLLLPDGSPDGARKLVRGPTTADGSEILDVVEKKGLLVLSKRNQSGVVRISAEHALPAKARWNGGAESDRSGNVYVSVSAPGSRKELRQTLFMFGADLEKIGELTLDTADSPGAVNRRRLVIDDNGDLYWMSWTRTEIRVWRHRLSTPT